MPVDPDNWTQPLAMGPRRQLTKALTKSLGLRSKLKILHVEDSSADSELVRQILLTNDLPCEITRVDSLSRLVDELAATSFDLILSDCKLPGFGGQNVLSVVREVKPQTPFIFVSGTMGEDAAIDSLRNGATDYVLKDRLARLAPAVRRALAEAKERDLLSQLQQRLREAGRLEAISTLSTGIAHDFNNILTIILGHASLLALDLGNPEQALEISSTISDAARRGADIVQQLLAFARKSDGPVASGDLDRYLDLHFVSLRAKLPPKVELILQPATGHPPVLIDPAQLDRILSNLLSNSVEAMPDGGYITLSTRVVSAGELSQLQPEPGTEEFVCLTVADTGRGIDSVTREHVFEPFFTTKDRGRGTGLGLPVVYGLMQAHHGLVDVKSEENRGTSVSLFFPVRKEVVPELETAAPETDGGETILVVEDEADVRFFVETILRSHGYRVLCAGDGDEALEVLSQHRDDIGLVFSDIGLPRVDGISLGERLRELKAELPIVLASGYPTKEFHGRLEQLGPQAFLAKPYQTHEILSVIRRALATAAATATA